jgi:hypothetical protein
LVFKEDGALLTAPADLEIDRSEGETLTVTAAGGLTDIQWSLNGTDFPGPRGTAASITVAAANYPAGTYRLGLTAKKGTVEYSTEITVRVVE